MPHTMGTMYCVYHSDRELQVPTLNSSSVASQKVGALLIQVAVHCLPEISGCIGSWTCHQRPHAMSADLEPPAITCQRNHALEIPDLQIISLQVIHSSDDSVWEHALSGYFKPSQIPSW